MALSYDASPEEMRAAGLDEWFIETWTTARARVAASPGEVAHAGPDPTRGIDPGVAARVLAGLHTIR
jgi:hypothetical protein